MSVKKPSDFAAVEAAAVWVSLDEIRPWSENPRKNDFAVKKVADSIKRFGFGSPILARQSDGEVIAGHTRIKAARLLGLKHVPVRYLDLSESDAHLLAVADNKLGELAEWDEIAVANILSDYGLEDAALAGFDSKELDKLAAGFAAEESNLDQLGDLPDYDKEGRVGIKLLVSKADAEAITEAMELTQMPRSTAEEKGVAIAEICRHYAER